MNKNPIKITLWEKLLLGLYLSGIAVGLIILAISVTIEDWWIKNANRYFQRTKVRTMRRDSDSGKL